MQSAWPPQLLRIYEFNNYFCFMNVCISNSLKLDKNSNKKNIHLVFSYFFSDDKDVPVLLITPQGFYKWLPVLVAGFILVLTHEDFKCSSEFEFVASYLSSVRKVCDPLPQNQS